MEEEKKLRQAEKMYDLLMREAMNTIPTNKNQTSRFEELTEEEREEIKAE